MFVCLLAYGPLFKGGIFLEGLLKSVAARLPMGISLFLTLHSPDIPSRNKGSRLTLSRTDSSESLEAGNTTLKTIHMRIIRPRNRNTYAGVYQLPIDKYSLA